MEAGRNGDGGATSPACGSSSCATKLVSFYVFNSTWGPREEEEAQKIVYFWPEGVSQDGQLRRIGLVEGVTRFMTKFSHQAAQSLHTQRERTVFLEAEPDFWLCLAVSLPWVRRPAAAGSSSATSGDIIEFRPEEVSDSTLLALLRQAHDMFCLFHGGLVSALKRSGGDRGMLTRWLDHFYSRYLAALTLDRADIVSEWGGIQYLALGAPEFLRVQSLVNRVEASMPIVRDELAISENSLYFISNFDLWLSIGKADKVPSNRVTSSDDIFIPTSYYGFLFLQDSFLTLSLFFKSKLLPDEITCE
jgi:hypothetical protein